MASSSINTAGYASPTKATAFVSSSTPWKQIVAGFGDAEDKAADDDKKPVWTKPSSETLEVVEPVMGADSWPALSDIAKFPQMSSVESPKSFRVGLFAFLFFPLLLLIIMLLCSLILSYMLHQA